MHPGLHWKWKEHLHVVCCAASQVKGQLLARGPTLSNRHLSKNDVDML